MVVPGSEMDSQGEGFSDQQQEPNKNHSFSSSLGRQSSSIYSLTLDEFQHTLCEPGKNFGSMNMDEFLSSIWNAEENQATNNNNNNNNNQNNNNNSIINNNNLSVGETATEKGLPRQGSLTIPAPLCRKTVEEVWSEIHKGQQSQQQNNNNNGVSGQNTESVPRQPTFGEMTLEDFLVKAGIVREQGANSISNAMPGVQVSSTSQHHQLPQQQYGVMYPNVGPAFRPVMGIGAGVAGGNAAAVVPPPYPAVAHGGGGGGAILEAKRDGGYSVVPGVGYGGRTVNGGGYGGNMGVGAPVSPVSPDGMGGGEFGMEMSVLRGRKRGLDGPVEKVVERRQRRMIKNRESAARSRARKQAYTVELEAELNQLKEENTQLKLALAELERRRKQQYAEESNGRVQTNAQKAKKKLRSLRRNLSCHL